LADGIFVYLVEWEQIEIADLAKDFDSDVELFFCECRNIKNWQIVQRVNSDTSATRLLFVCVPPMGFVPRLVEKQLAESFITRLSSQEQVWSNGFEEPG